VIHPMGSAVAAYFAGVLRIACGTYFEAFIFSGMLLVAVAVMVLFISADSRPKVDAFALAGE
jgi:hypothetical protein